MWAEFGQATGVHVRNMAGQCHNGLYRVIVTTWCPAQAAAAYRTMRSWYRYDGRGQPTNYTVRIWADDRDTLDRVVGPMARRRR